MSKKYYTTLNNDNQGKNLNSFLGGLTMLGEIIILSLVVIGTIFLLLASTTETKQKKHGAH